MEKESKYYVPEIEEFCIGFECEFAQYISTDPHNRYASELEGWRECLINRPTMIPSSKLDLSKFRVKYLDSQDIIDYGFRGKYSPQDAFHDSSILRSNAGSAAEGYQQSRFDTKVQPWREALNSANMIFNGIGSGFDTYTRYPTIYRRR